jgi:hypothetical protein
MNIRRFNQALLGKWFGLLMRKELGGDRCWWRNMGRIGEVGARESFQVRMGWACGNLFVWDSRILGGFANLMLVRA